MLYTITFRSGAQQTYDLDEEAIQALAEGWRAVHENKNPDGVLIRPGQSGILLSEVVGFDRYVSMAEKYGLTPSAPTAAHAAARVDRTLSGGPVRHGSTGAPARSHDPAT